MLEQVPNLEILEVVAPLDFAYRHADFPPEIWLARF